MPNIPSAEEVKEGVVDLAKDQLKKQAFKAALAAAGPYLVPVLGGIVVVGFVSVIAVAIIGNVISNGSAGKSSHVATDKNDSKQVADVKTTLALASDSNAKSEAVNNSADSLITALDKVRVKAKNKGDDATVKTMDIYIEQASMLNTSNPTQNAQVITGSIEQWKGSLSEEQQKNYASEIREVDSVLKIIQAVISISPRLVIPPKDMYYIQNYEVDHRVIKLLNYLVTPKESGGAGFRKIKVYRIKSEYDTEGRRFSREWGDETDEKPISAHFDGQAVDIEGIDQIERHLYKKSIRKKKREERPAVDIVVAQQSNKAGKSDVFGSSVDGKGIDYQKIFESGGASQLFAVLAESTGYDFSRYDTSRVSTFADAVKIIGMVAMNEELGIMTDENSDASDGEQIFANIGKNIISNCLNLPTSALGDDFSLTGSYDDYDTYSKTGRETLAERMSLPAYSLSGNTSGELIYSIGARKIEDSFGIRPMAIDDLKANDDFVEFLGRSYIEKKMILPAGSLKSNDLGQIKNAVGSEKFDKAFTANPSSTDYYLGFPTLERRYTDDFINGRINPFDYKKTMGQIIMASTTDGFASYNAATPVTLSGYSSANKTTIYRENIGDVQDSRDEVKGLPEKSIDRIKVNDLSVFYDIGLHELAKKLTDNENEREVIKEWIRNHRSEPLEDMLFIEGNYSKKLYIKSRSQIRNPDRGRIQVLTDELNYYKKLKGELTRSSNRSDLADEIKVNDIRIKQKEEEIFVEGGNEEKWALLSEEYFNDSLGIQSDGISQMFLRDKGEEVFYSLGKEKLDEAVYKNDNPGKSQSAAKLKFYENQAVATETRLTELRAKKTGTGDESALDSEILQLERSLKYWKSQASVERGISAEETSEKSKSNTASKTASYENGIGCKDLKKEDIFSNLGTFSVQVGKKKMELTLGLPSDSLEDRFDVKKIGQRHVENTLGMPKGNFSGADLLALIQKNGGVENLFKYFAKDSDQANLIKNLPIRSANEGYYKSVFKKTDALFGLKNDETYDLMTGAINAEKYSEVVGKVYLKDQAPGTLTEYFDLNVGGYKLTSEDMTSMLKDGNFLPVILKIGAKKADDSLVLPEGTVKAMIDNPGLDCKVTDQTTGIQQNCIESILIASGKAKAAQYMGVLGYTDISGNIDENIAQSIIESRLHTLYPNPPLTKGWFTGSTLYEMARIMARNDNSDTWQANVAYYNEAEINKAEKKIIQKFGFNPGDGTQNSMANLKNTNFVENSAVYGTAKKVDETLNLTVGTTANLFTEKITVQEYKKLVQKAFSSDRMRNLIYNSVDDDFKPYVTAYFNNEETIKSFLGDKTKQKAAKQILDNRISEEEKKANSGYILGELEIERKLDPQNTLAPGWFFGKNIKEVVENVAKAKHFGEANQINAQNITEARNILLQLFGFDINSYKIFTKNAYLFEPGMNDKRMNIKDAPFGDANSDVAKNAKRIDALLKIREGSTAELFQETITPAEYSERVNKSYLKYEGANIAYEAFAPEEWKERYGISGDDFASIIENPSAAYNVVMMHNPQLVSAALGLGIDVPVNGEFTAEFAQKLIESTLGLQSKSETKGKKGFSPGTNILEIMKENGASNFARSFRINLDYRTSEANIEAFLKNNVFRNDANSIYWSDPKNISKSALVDSALKIDAVAKQQYPTKALLQGTISVAEYIEIVRANQFARLDVNGLRGYMTSADNNKEMSMADAYVGAWQCIQEMDNLRRGRSSVCSPAQALSVLEKISQLDLDDKMGFTPGTAENIMKDPKNTRSILIAQGINNLSKQLFGDEELAKRKYLLNYFQYYVPTFDQGYYVNMDPGGANACDVTPDQSLQTEEQQALFIKNKKSTCQHYIINQELKNAVYNNTIIYDQNGNKIMDGITLPPKALEGIRQGDRSTLSAIGLVYGINSIRAEQDKDGNALKPLPSDFQISIDEAMTLMNPTTTNRADVSIKAGLTDWPKENTIQKRAVDLAKSGTDPVKAREQAENEFREGKIKTEPAPVPGGVCNQNPQGQAEINESINCAKKNVEYTNYVDKQKEYTAGKQKDYAPSLKKELGYRYADAQLRALAAANNTVPIPAGFTRTMKEGTEEERYDMLLAYGFSHVIEKTDFFTSETCQDRAYVCQGTKDAVNNFIKNKDEVALRSYFTSGQVGVDVVRNGLMSATDTFLGQQMKELGVGLSVPKGTSEYVLDKATQMVRPDLIGQKRGAELADFENTTGKDFAINLATNSVDKALGAKPGTTAQLYSTYKAYQSYQAAKTVYQNTKAVIDAMKAAGASKAAIDSATKGLNSAKGGLTKTQANLVVIGVAVLTFVFAEDLAKVDANLGLPPGTLASIISAGVSLYFAAAVGPVGVAIAVAMMLYTAIWGYSKIEMQMTCLPPIGENDEKALREFNPGAWLGNRGNIYCKEDGVLYTRWAQLNTRKLIDDILRVGDSDRTGDNSLLPTMIGTFRDEDLDYFNGRYGTPNLVQQKYGISGPLRGMKGLWQSDYMGSFVHIGY